MVEHHRTIVSVEAEGEELAELVRKNPEITPTKSYTLNPLPYSLLKYITDCRESINAL